MKKLLILLLAFISSMSVLYAEHVSPEKAKEIAILLMKAKQSNFNGRVQSVQPLSQGFESSIYLINFYPQGWMMLSADDASLPLLAYSTTDHFKAKNMPDNMRKWLKTYDEQIKENVKFNRTALKQWDKTFYTYERKARAIASPIEPLIKVRWDQSTPYNAYCPESGGQKALVGCVAVAMGQALSVLQYPARPVGKHADGNLEGLPYAPVDYDKEAPYDWENILDGFRDNYNEVARLLYHLGTSVDMIYGINESGAYTFEVPKALVTHFSFPEDLYFQWREKYEGDWKQFILNELGAGRPLIYSGVDKQARAGHAFNIDGYDGEASFHVNWGWSGQGNAYYSLDALRDDVMHMNYAQQQGAVIGLRVPSNRPTNIILSNKTAASGKKPGEVVGQLSVENEQSGHEYQYLVRGKYNKLTSDYQEVPFKVEGNQLIASASLAASSKKYEVEIVAIDQTLNASIKQGFTIQITGNAEALKSVEESTSMIFNKATGVLKLTCVEGVSYQITSAQGATVLNGVFQQDPSIVWNTKDVPAGVYTITLKNEDDIKSFTVNINSKK